MPYALGQTEPMMIHANRAGSQHLLENAEGRRVAKNLAGLFKVKPIRQCSCWIQACSSSTISSQD